MANQDTAWSAAFISYVMSPTGRTFPGRASHTGYAQAIRNSINNEQTYGRTWKLAYDVLDPTKYSGPNSTYPLKPGDIIIQNRIGRPIEFDTDPWDTAGTHGDIVVEVRSGNLIREVDVIGGNWSNTVTRRTIRFYPTLNSQYSPSVTQLPATTLSVPKYFVVIRPKVQAYADWAVKRALIELGLWRNLTAFDEAADPMLTKYFRAAGERYERSRTVGVRTPYDTKNSVSPYITSLQSFHPNIQYELTRRRFASETVNTHMPFIKLTSLMYVNPVNLVGGGEAWCPSLGIHGAPEVSFDEMYSPQGKKSIVGYASAPQGKRVAVVVEKSQFDPENIPVPGIVEASAERSLAGPMGVRGGLLRANLKIRAYSIGQVNALMKYYFRPSTRVVLEFGRKSSSTTEKRESSIKTYDWTRDATIIANEIKGLIAPAPSDDEQNNLQRRQEKFIQDYVYNNDGNYEIFIGYVAGFNMKYTKNNTFEIELSVNSTQQFEIPNVYTGVKQSCSESATVQCLASDVHQYFDTQYSWMPNTFSSLMSKVLGQEIGENANDALIQWADDVIRIADSSMQENNTENNRTENPGTSGNYAGTGRGGYFVSWKFFIDVILNDPDYGILSTYSFKNAEDLAVKELLQTGLLRSTLTPSQSDEYAKPDTLVANRVGYHPMLRSTNLNVMMIYNKIAQEEAELKVKYTDVVNVASSINISLNDSQIYDKVVTSRVGSFKQLGNGGERVSGYGSLFEGIWLNTDAIVSAFTTTDTISAALSKLLTDMNLATAGYWNLQLLSNDARNPGMHVIDMGLSPKMPEQQIANQDTENLTSPQSLLRSRYTESNNKPKYIYVFNRRTKQFLNDDIGSELLDLNIDYKIPLMMAVQAIAGVGGPAETSTLTMGGTRDIQNMSLIKNLYTTCTNNTLANSLCDSSPEALELANQSRIQRDLDETENNPNPYADAMFSNEIGSMVGGVRNPADGLRDQLAASNATLTSLRNPQLQNVIRTYAHLGSAIRFTSYNVSELQKYLYADSRTAEQFGTEPDAHAFNSSNLTKLLVDLTIPGIGGIELWQSFLIDRVPSIIDRGYFVVTKVSHQFKKETGWITMLQGMFRYKPVKEQQSTTQLTPLDEEVIRSGGGTRGFGQRIGLGQRGELEQ